MILNIKFTHFLKSHKKIISIIALIVIGLLLSFKLLKKNNLLTSDAKTEDAEYSYDDLNIKNDSLQKLGFCANTNFVITEDADVRRTPNKAMYNSIYNLKYGTKVYTKNIDKKSKIKDIDKTLLERETRNNFVAIYAEKPIFLTDKPVGYMLKEDLIERSDLKNYKPKPKEPDKIKLESGIKATIESNLTIDNEEYNFIEDARRFNKSIVYGDFNSDDIGDFAVILDNKDISKSAVQIYFKNIQKNQYELVYKKVYNSLLKIKTIEHNNNIMVNSESTTFPIDGVLITNASYNTFFHIYNTDNKSFMVLPN